MSPHGKATVHVRPVCLTQLCPPSFASRMAPRTRLPRAKDPCRHVPPRRNQGVAQGERRAAAVPALEHVACKGSVSHPRGGHSESSA